MRVYSHALSRSSCILRTVLAYSSNLDGSNAERRATNQLTRIKKNFLPSHARVYGCPYGKSTVKLVLHRYELATLLWNYLRDDLIAY